MDEPVISSAGLALSEPEVFAAFCDRFALAGADVAEIGGCVDAGQLEGTGVRSWWAVDPRHPQSAAGLPEGGHGTVVALHGRAEAMPLPESSVDVVFSCNAFEFVNVGRALAESARVLRPGGMLYAHFGPIWSGVDGHQLEYVRWEGRDLVFWRDTLLPPWAHLLYDEDELRQILRTGIDERLVELVVDHVFHSAKINRLFLEQYVDLALAGPLDVVEIAASDELDYEIRTPPYEHPLLAEQRDIHDRIFARYGRAYRAGPRDVRLVLRRPTAVPRS
jgi:SAM-dependent methyltransferase